MKVVVCSLGESTVGTLETAFTEIGVIIRLEPILEAIDTAWPGEIVLRVTF